MRVDRRTQQGNDLMNPTACSPPDACEPFGCCHERVGYGVQYVIRRVPVTYLDLAEHAERDAGGLGELFLRQTAGEARRSYAMTNPATVVRRHTGLRSFRPHGTVLVRLLSGVMVPLAATGARAGSASVRHQQSVQFVQRVYVPVGHTGRIIGRQMTPWPSANERGPQAGRPRRRDVVAVVITHINDLLRVCVHPFDDAREESRVWLRHTPFARCGDVVHGEIKLAQQLRSPSSLVPGNPNSYAGVPQRRQRRPNIGVEIALLNALTPPNVLSSRTLCLEVEIWLDEP